MSFNIAYYLSSRRLLQNKSEIGLVRNIRSMSSKSANHAPRRSKNYKYDESLFLVKATNSGMLNKVSAAQNKRMLLTAGRGHFAKSFMHFSNQGSGSRVSNPQGYYIRS